MKTILTLVAASGLLIGSATIGYAQSAGVPRGGMTPGSGSSAQFGSVPGSAAPFGSSPDQQTHSNGSTPGEPAVSNDASGGGNMANERDDQTVGSGGAWLVAPSTGRAAVERHDHTITRENDITTGRADRGCTTQTYRVPSAATGDKTSVDVVRC